MFSKKLAIAALVAAGVAISSAPAQASAPSRYAMPEAGDEVLVFSGDAYDNEMGIIAILIGLHHRPADLDMAQPDM